MRGGASIRQWTVDAFAARPFRGNPACVVEPLETWPDAVWMQALAAENNQPVTAFLRRTADPTRFGLRWFTPTLELSLCGHGTLASAHVLLAELGFAAERLAFETDASGVLTMTRAGDRYEMDFPADVPRRIETPASLAEALGAAPVEVWAGQYLVAVMTDAASVRGLAPDHAALKTIGAEAAGGPGKVGVVAPADPGADHDLVSRFFAPGSGVAEDPTCGSLHCILSPLYANKLGRPCLRFHQAYPGRGGDLECEIAGDRVRLRGSAVTVLEGKLRV